MTAQHADPGPTRDELAAWLLTIDEDKFRDIVARDVKKRLDYDAAQALRHPTVLVRWGRTLKVLIKDANVQVSEKGGHRADRDWYAAVSRWQERLMQAQSEAQSLTARFAAQAQHASSLEDKRARGEVRDAAISRLINAHRAEWEQLYAEECAIAGLPAKVRPSTAVVPFRTAGGSQS